MSTVKGKNLLLMGATFFLQYTPFQKGPDVQESKQEVIKLANRKSLLNMAENHPSVSKN